MILDGTHPKLVTQNPKLKTQPMSVIRIATRYAKSLLELANEQGKLEAVHNDVLLLQSASTNRDLHLMLKSPIIQADKKIAVMNALFGSKMDKLTMAYVSLLANKGREGYLPEIAAEFLNQYRSYKKITAVRIITSETLGESVLSDIRAKIIASGVATDNLEVETAIDPALIGGFVLEFDNKRYNASLSHKLEEMKDLFTQNLYVKDF